MQNNNNEIQKQKDTLIEQVYDAKADSQKADQLISSYIPFIRSEASKSIGRFCTEQDDEYSIALIAFHEAILGYSSNRGAFLSYASMVIKSRILDYKRKESRHQDLVSLDSSDYINADKSDEDSNRSLIDMIPDKNDHYEESMTREATSQEIQELSKVLNDFGLTFTDIADNSPKQERTLKACRDAINYAIKNKFLLDQLLETKKLPIAQLVNGSGAERKTLERHRKYLLAMLIIQTNGYEIIRGHLRRVLNKKGEAIS